MRVPTNSVSPANAATRTGSFVRTASSAYTCTAQAPPTQTTAASTCTNLNPV